MNKQTLIIMMTLCLLERAQAVFRFGKCPSFTTQSGFTISSYYGTWYEYARVKYFFFELGAECSTATYSANSDGSIKVVNSEETIWKKIKTVDGSAECDSA